MSNFGQPPKTPTDDWGDQEEAFFGHSNSTSSPSSATPTTRKANSGNYNYHHEKQNLPNKSRSIASGIASLERVAKSSMRKMSENFNLSTVGQYPASSRPRMTTPTQQQNRNNPPFETKRPIRSNIMSTPSPYNNLPQYSPRHHHPTTKTTTTTTYPPGSSTIPSNNENNSSSFGSIMSSLTSAAKRRFDDVIPTCIACGAIAPNPYRFHPFFPHEKICSTHQNATTTCCTSCQRFEPCPSIVRRRPEKEFADLQDHGRKICPACVRSIVIDSEDAVPLWQSVMMYFDHSLNIFRNVPDAMKRRMLEIPVLMVGHDGLNDPSVKGSGHGGNNGLTRGMCMFEYRYHPLGGGLRQVLQNSGFSSSSAASSSSSRPRLSAISKVLNFVSDGLSSSRVSAILCLKGLPRDLVVSILAHEATHAWFKLHPHFNPHSQIPSQVEEGCCQLLAFLYLSHLEEMSSGVVDGKNKMIPDYGDDGEPTDKKLRQYFRYCIETDTSHVYGDGFRLAAEAYASLNSVPALLEYIVENHAFPS